MSTGSPQLEDGFIRIANELMEAILGFSFSLRETLVVLTIIRKTYGFGKKEDDISASQIADMCRVPRQHVTTTLNLLAQRNVITKRAGRFGSIIGIQKDHRKWITGEQMKGLACPNSGQVDSSKSEPVSSISGEEDDLNHAGSLVPIQDTCPGSGHVPNRGGASPNSGQVDSPKTGHTKDNLPKENQQKTKSCAPKVERDHADDLPAGGKRRAKTGASEQVQERFERFYAAYPRKKSRAAAEKAFKKINPDELLLNAMLDAINAAKASEEWSDPQFIPHPATWLNGCRWLDEIQTEYSADELATIKLFNELLGHRLGEVPETPFVPSRAAAIRSFPSFSPRPKLAERFFSWIRDGNIDLPPHVGFDWLLTREGFTKACGKG